MVIIFFVSVNITVGALNAESRWYMKAMIEKNVGRVRYMCLFKKEGI